MIDLGAGNDSFTLAAGGTLLGSVSGGAGTNNATLQTTGDTTLAGGTLTSFQTLTLQGAGTATFARGASAFDRVNAPGNVVVAQGATLATSQLTLGGGDDRLLVGGVFTGSVDGGTGNDRIDVSGGTAAAPVAFRDVTNIEAFAMSGGFASVAGTAAFRTLDLAGGRLVGLAGSTIAAPTINVGAGATFGSAGTVNGDVVVAGTLSPGASPGTMTVNGNVALAGGSLSLFEITPTVSDKLVVNGAVSIASGATLQLVPGDGVTAVGVRDLIVASGGISGSFATVLKPASLIGTLVQRGDRIALVGQFVGDSGSAPQVQRSIAYLNAVLVSGQASNAVLAALPALTLANGASNVVAFRQLTPEAYASARQIAVENGLTLVGVARGQGFAAPQGDRPALFSFGEGLGNWRSLSAGGSGASTAQISGYGLVGGLGWGSERASLGGFVGYLNSHQRIGTLGAQTSADGIVGGVHGRIAAGGWRVSATLAYDGGDADTRRAVLDRGAGSHYALRGWTGDVALSYALPLGTDWSLRPSVGATVIRSSRHAANESGSSAFTLGVRGGSGTAAFVDGALSVRGGITPGHAMHPTLSLGMRYQASDRLPLALASLGGGGYDLLADGSRRAPVIATATLGFDADVTERVVLFGTLTGERGAGDHRESGRLGLRIRM